MSCKDTKIILTDEQIEKIKLACIEQIMHSSSWNTDTTFKIASPILGKEYLEELINEL